MVVMPLEWGLKMPRKSCNSCGNFVDCGKKDHACLNSGRSVWVAKEMTPAEYYERWCKLRNAYTLLDDADAKEAFIAGFKSGFGFGKSAN